MKSETPVYSPISSSDHPSCSDDSESPLVEKGWYKYQPPQSPSSKIHIYRIIGEFLLLLLSVGFFTAAALKKPSEKQCVEEISVFTPMLDAVEYQELNFDNDFRHETVYRGTPSFELERAWETLWNRDLMSVPEDKFHYFNKSADEEYIKVDPKHGGGYAVNIEVFHQLHCLNLIRQYTWREYYPKHLEHFERPYDLEDDDVGLRTHVDHCIEALRINLMCIGDVTPYLIKKRNDSDRGIADFSSHHKCRKFDKLVDFWEDNTVIQRWPGGNRQYTKEEYAVKLTKDPSKVQQVF